jgi:thioredoxin reductase (NADPH)
MSQYLADKVRAQGNITVRTETEVAAVDGDGVLRSVTLKDASGKVTLEADELFIMIGAVPSTGWLPPEVAKDKLGYVLAGGDLPDESRARFVDSCGRQPFAHETGMPGLFVAGDVRSGTIKRVATASGDGAGVIPELHRYCER